MGALRNPMGVGPTRRLTITSLQSALAPQHRNPVLTESIFPGLISRRRNYSVKMRIGHQRGIQCMDKGNKAARQKAMQVHDMRHACLRMPPECHHRDSGNHNVRAQNKNIGTRATNMPCTQREQTIKNKPPNGKHKDTHLGTMSK